MAVGALEALGIVFVGQWMVSTFENVDWVIFGGLDIVVFVLGFPSLLLIMFHLLLLPWNVWRGC